MKMEQLKKSKLVKTVKVITMVSAIFTLIVSAFSSLLIFKLIHYLDTAQKALPKIERAAQLYTEQNTLPKKQSDE